jgi:hypothetical protein
LLFHVVWQHHEEDQLAWCPAVADRLRQLLNFRRVARALKLPLRDIQFKSKIFSSTSHNLFQALDRNPIRLPTQQNAKTNTNRGRIQLLIKQLESLGSLHPTNTVTLPKHQILRRKNIPLYLSGFQIDQDAELVGQAAVGQGGGLVVGLELLEQALDLAAFRLGVDDRQL